MDTLLLEIGTEEIPPGYIKPALSAMSEMILNKLDHARIDHGAFHVFGTPKKMSIIVEGVAAMQKAVSTEVMGPPEKVAFDGEGNPKVPAVKFAEKVGIAVDKIVIKETDKGRYLSAVVDEEVLPSLEILSKILPETILSLPFPKTMRWADLDVSFARPVVSILAILGDRVVPFTVGDIVSGRLTHGHRFMNPGPIEIKAAEDYVSSLRDARVYVDTEERESRLAEVIDRAVGETGGTVLDDPELLSKVNNLVEYPAVSVGRIDDEFMALPREVLITSMREHQKYFAVVDENGGLLPYFAAVNNTEANDPSLVQRGHEKVLRARLADAKFFYNVDVKDAMDEWVDKLGRVLFQAKLGSVLDKTDRFGRICDFLADGLVSLDEAGVKNLKRAARLCKADLVSQMVIEFTELQGVMGRIYAQVAGEESAVSLAIEEHYRPTHAGGDLPTTGVGSVLSIADKMDTLCGCFSVGLIPTGGSDPYALRRQSIGIVNIMLSSGFTFSLKSLIQFGVEGFKDKTDQDPQAVADQVYEFIKARVARMLVDEGFEKDVVAAVTEVSIDVIPDVWKRVRALQEMKKDQDFEPLAAAFKRVVNIIRKAEGSYTGDVDAALFKEPSEEALWKATREAAETVDQSLSAGEFGQALVTIASLKGVVDQFFDDVMVMDEDLAIRNNRLMLLGRIAGLFAGIADFSRITTAK